MGGSSRKMMSEGKKMAGGWREWREKWGNGGKIRCIIGGGPHKIPKIQIMTRRPWCTSTLLLPHPLSTLANHAPGHHDGCSHATTCQLVVGGGAAPRGIRLRLRRAFFQPAAPLPTSTEMCHHHHHSAQYTSRLPSYSTICSTDGIRG